MPLKIQFGLFLLLIILILQKATADNLQTIYEKSNFKATANYDQTITYCQKLARRSPWIQYKSFGKSPQGYDLPLLIVNRDGIFTPKKIDRKNKVLLFIQAGIHPGEIDGKDAGLLLLRNLIIKKQNPDLFGHVVVLFIPIFNVDGYHRFSAFNRINQNGPKEMGWRTTAQNLNLNRDYLKADAPEMKAWLKLFNRWLPDFFADCHVTDGADYQYALTYHLDSHGILDSTLMQWVQSDLVPFVKQRMLTLHFPIIDYIMFRNHHDPKNGMIGWAASPRFSNGYADIQDRPGLLIETHALKDYHTRVTATYDMLESLLIYLHKHYRSLRQKITRADAYTASSEFRNNPYPLTYRLTNDSVMIDFLGYDYKAVRSHLTGGIWYQYNESSPRIFRIPFFNRLIPQISVRLPLAYIIPREWQSVIERLKLHGIIFRTLKRPVRLRVHTYKFSNASFNKFPYEGRQMAKFKTNPIVFERNFPAGSVVVPMNQQRAKVIAHILEPDAPDSFVRWGFFNTIFEQKEYAESYVMEGLARKMLAKDPQIKKAFEQKIKSDSTFAKNPRAILNWFYRHSPYWDRFKDVYPVGRIFNQTTFNTLPLN